MTSLSTDLAPGRLDFSAMAAQLGSQPELFACGSIPVEVDTVTAARTGAFSGTTTCNSKHETRALTIAALRLAGVSKRQVAEQLRCSRNTIDAVMEVLDARGKIEPLKERLPRLMASAAGEAMEWAREIIEERIVSADRAATLKALGVLGGITLTHMQAAAPHQAAGDLHLHQHVHLEGADPMREFLRARAAALSTDSHAACQPHNALVDNATSDQTAALAACAEPSIEVQVESLSPPSPDAPPDADQVPTGGGGGLVARPAGEDKMANPSDH